MLVGFLPSFRLPVWVVKEVTRRISDDQTHEHAFLTSLDRWHFRWQLFVWIKNTDKN
jgi:hypothetical protein